MKVEIKVKNTHRKRMRQIVNEVGAQLRARCPDLQEATHYGRDEVMSARLTKGSVSAAGGSRLFRYVVTKRDEVTE